MSEYKVSVVIPCRNEKKHIKQCVESILASDYKNLEILVVDGMSDDGTRIVLSELSQLHSNVFIIDNPNKLTPYAFNLGCKAATGFYVQIVGSRNILAPDYISLLIKTLEKNPDIACTGGDYQHIYDTPMSRFIAYAMESKFGVGSSNYRTKKESQFVDTVGIPMYRKSIFDEIGYFDERLTRNQDDDFNFRLTQTGKKIYYNFEAKTQYIVRGTLPKLFKQFSQYGYFKVFVNQKHKTITTTRQLAPIFFFFFLILGFFISLFSCFFSLFYISVLILYFSLGFIASYQHTKKLKEVFITQYAIFLMHMGYASGYAQGILDFLILKKQPQSKMQKQTA